ncbi:MAG: Uma2 family endonuclease [Mycobacteriales bacterium]
MAFMTVMHRATNDWTVADLENLPNDGLQYELIDGVLIVSPAPIPLHQRAVGKLFTVLNSGCPPELEVFFAPLDFQPNFRTSVQPDVLVVRVADLGEKNLTVAPLLAVEVLSPSTRRKDLVLKRSVYQDAGVAAYWVFDPDEPSFRAWELREGQYTEAGFAAGKEKLTLNNPYPVTICPNGIITRQLQL